MFWELQQDSARQFRSGEIGALSVAGCPRSMEGVGAR